MFGKMLINVSMDLKKSFYLKTNFIFDEGLIIRDGGNIFNECHKLK
jgi:hypothetical protein